MSEEIIEINSLQDFISIFEEEKFSGNFYYRGEPMDYSSMVLKEGMAPIDTRNMASGYRWALQNEKTFDDILWLRKDYYREVGHSLTSKETENFIAYAQHHGLPTELLDITLNPAVALYFACEQNQDKDGYVYLLDNNGFDRNGKNNNTFYKSLTNTLTTNLNSSEPENQYIRFRWFPEDSIGMHINIPKQKISNQFVRDLFQASDINILIEQIFNQYNELKKKNYTGLDQLSKVTKGVFDVATLEQANTKFKELTTLSYRGDTFTKYQSATTAIVNMSMELTNIFELDYFPNLKLLLHKPSIIFDRMRNQNGEFIYQLNIEKNNKLVNQKVIPSYIFNIPADKKNRIMSQLNSIGINRKFIYPDVDNTAKYITSNYSKSYLIERHPLEHLSFK